MKKILTFLIAIAIQAELCLYSVGAATFSWKDVLPTTVKWVTGSWSIGDVTFSETTNTLDLLLDFIKDSIFGILALVAIWMFLYVWFSLVKAQWNPDELKKAFMTLIHVIIGLFIVAVSWAVITMVSSITF